MIKKGFYSRRAIGNLTVLLLGLEFLRHLGFVAGLFPYAALWGAPLTTEPSLHAAAGGLMLCLLLAMGACFKLGHHRFLRRDGGGRPRFVPLGRGLWAGYAVLIFAALLTLGYWRCDPLALRLVAGCGGAVFLLLFARLLRLVRRDGRRARKALARRGKARDPAATADGSRPAPPSPRRSGPPSEGPAPPGA
jgi:hypothetical protein